MTISEQKLKPVIFIYSLSGKLLNRFAWTHGDIADNGIGWSDKCILMIVSTDGVVYQFDALGNEVGHFECTNLLGESKVMNCQFWSSGVALMSVDLKIVVAALDRYDHTLQAHLTLLYENHPITLPPPCWIVIPPDPDAGEDSHDCLALVATTAEGEEGEGGVCAIDSMSYQQHSISKGTISKMALSPCGKMLAFFESTCVNVVFSDFSQNIAQFDTECTVPPDQMQFCGSDCVVLTWDTLAFIVGPGGEWLKFDFDSPSCVITECDCLRIISNEVCETLERVPDVTVEIFSCGSDKPGASLHTAMSHFDEKNSEASNYIRQLLSENSLPAAVDSCISAATVEFGRKTQRSLLRAASLGKAFAESYSSDRFVQACKTLRVLNAVRDFEIGMPITYEQLQKLTLNGLIDRLMSQNRHLLALRICESMDLSPRRVYTHWACQKVRKQDVPSSIISDQITNMMRDKVGIPYAQIAEAAFKAGRVDLATSLILHEPRAFDQVPLLFSMKNFDLALQKALDSGDTDLAYDVIHKLRNSSECPDWFNIIRSKPTGMSLLLNSLKDDESMLERILGECDMHVELAEHFARKAYGSKLEDDMTSRMNEAKNQLKMVQQRDPSYSFAVNATEDQIKLLLVQREKEITTGKRLCRQPLADTVRELLIIGDLKGAQKLRSDFKMSEKKFWWLRVQAIAVNGKSDVMAFNQLERLAKEKKSPIGYEPFVDVCIEANLPVEAEKYIQMIPDIPKRIPYYVRIGKFREAVDCAFKTKDPLAYARQILPACKKPEDRAMVESLFQQASK